MSQPLTVRSVRDDETDDVLAYVRANGIAPLARRTWDGLGMSAYVAEAGGQIVAALPIEPREVLVEADRVVRVLHEVGIHVDEPFRRQGLGTLLQTQVHGIAGKVGAVAVTAWAQSEPAYQWYGHSDLLPEHAADLLSLAPAAGEAADWADEVADLPPAVGQVARPLAAWTDVHPRAVDGGFGTARAGDAEAVLVVDGDRAEVMAWRAGDAAALIAGVRALAEQRGWLSVDWAVTPGDDLHQAATDAGATVAGHRHLMVKPVGHAAGAVDFGGWRHRGIDHL